MKKYLVAVLFLLVTHLLQSQSLSSQQEADISAFSQSASGVLAGKILNEFLAIDCTVCYAAINILPAQNTDGKVTDLGIHLSQFLESSLQAKLNASILKKYHFRVNYSTEETLSQQNNEYQLKIQYFLQANSIGIVSANIESAHKRISLQPFEIQGNTRNIEPLNVVSKNVNYDKILYSNGQQNYLDSLLVYKSNNSIIRSNNEAFELKNNELYRLRFFLKMRTFLYVFYYEPNHSAFYMLFPQNSAQNRALTFHIKDLNNVRFTNIRKAHLIVVVSDKAFDINRILAAGTSTLSPQQAETIFREIMHHNNELSINAFQLNF